ncbi:VWA domain-containing protein [Vibrio sp. SCSIO 43136]|uniref:vWA domain-containing protein n=1 Tax=Vibrio sp. SCSIO 43136 TaxID=2819101 RepID=UPI0020750C89|nr:VWA domain-containing protein [Vibrio sp. SCSIO 43136]USD64271.1 VWA domain-containing protein [Vibrio sp. SCSIO 43136]
MIEGIKHLNLVFEQPWMFMVLPLPVVIYFLVPAYRSKQFAIKVPFFNRIVEALDEPLTEGADQLSPKWWQRLALIFTWVLIVCAMAKPVVLGETQTREKFGRDIMVALDLSGSMAEQDFISDTGHRLSRLEAAKAVLADFANRRQGDRLGLILFGDAAFVQTPFTDDLDVWQALLNQTDVAMAGQSTHLGDAIGLAIKVFQQSEVNDDREQVVIVLTDGNDTGSFVEPIEAAKVASALNVRIHVVAMGDPNTVGESAMDMHTIERIAKDTGGRAFQALDRLALEHAYQQIDALEPQRFESTTYRPKQSAHHYFISLVVVIYLLAFSAASMKRRWNRLAQSSTVGDKHV